MTTIGNVPSPLVLVRCSHCLVPDTVVTIGNRPYCDRCRRMAHKTGRSPALPPCGCRPDHPSCDLGRGLWALCDGIEDNLCEETDPARADELASAYYHAEQHLWEHLSGWDVIASPDALATP